MAILADEELAYLTWRPVEPGSADGAMEVGVLGHGPAGATLADRVATEIHTWDQRFRHRNVWFEILAGDGDVADPTETRFRLARPHNPIAVVWQ